MKKCIEAIRKMIVMLSMPLIIMQLTACASTQNLLSKLPSPGHKKQEEEAGKTLEAEDYAKAITLYNELLKTAPDNKTYQLKLADSYRLNGEIARSHVLYDRIIASAARDALWISALEGKGLSYMQEGNFEEAIKRFNVVISEDATRWRTLNAVGVALALTNRAKEAMDYYQMALQLSNNQPSVLNNMGLSYALSGNLPKGIEVLERASVTVPAGSKQQPRIALNLALVYGIAGRMAEAEKAAKPYLPERALYNNLSYYALLSKNEPLAKEYLSRALGSNPAQYQKAWQGGVR